VIDLDGIRLGLVDTAGIRASDDEVEREGVARARGAASVADLVVLVLDRSRPLEDSDRALLRDTASAPRVIVVNKIDLPAAWGGEELEQHAAGPDDGPPGGASRGPDRTGRARPAAQPLLLSLKTGEGLDELRGAMREALEVGEPLRDAPIVTNVRHETLLREAREAVARALENLARAGESASEELVLADLADARRALEEVTGRRTSEDVLRGIFERFCIGK
jgi:tRNA modification GTPase